MRAQQARQADGLPLLTALEGFLTRYAAVPQGMPLVLALYTVMTHCFEVFDALAYVAVTSPTKGCGKTRVLELLSIVCARPRSTVGITQAALFRVIDKDKPTLIVDESESLSGKTDRAEAIREIANAGYKRGQKVMRCEPRKGGKYEVMYFDVFGPKVFALIGKLPPTLADRSIGIRMHRSRKRLARYRLAHVEPEGRSVREQLAVWVAAHKDEIKAWYESNDLDFLEGRNEELWLPLFSVCAVLCSERLLELEASARQYAGAKDVDESDEIGLRLLSDIRDLFEQRGTERLASATIVDALNAIQDSPWPGWSYGRGLDARGLSILLRPFGIQPQNIRLDAGVVKGYLRESFEEVWESYLSPPIRYTATEGMNTGENAVPASATPAPCSGSQNPPSPSNDAGCSAVADKTPSPRH